MNKQEFLDLADTIEEANRFDLNVYAMWTDHDDHLNRPEPEVLLHNCGTAGCIAGYQNARKGRKDLGDEEMAGYDLGITFSKSDRLFKGWSNSIWAELADEYGWETCRHGLSNWSVITAPEAADVLRKIARGEITL